MVCVHDILLLRSPSIFTHFISIMLQYNIHSLGRLAQSV